MFTNSMRKTSLHTSCGLKEQKVLAVIKLSFAILTAQGLKGCSIQQQIYILYVNVFIRVWCKFVRLFRQCMFCIFRDCSGLRPSKNHSSKERRNTCISFWSSRYWRQRQRCWLKGSFKAVRLGPPTFKGQMAMFIAT